MDAYLAILGKQGLAALVEESDVARRFFAARCYWQLPYREAVYWATLSPASAVAIARLIAAGYPEAALCQLDREAFQLGLLSPSVLARSTEVASTAV